MNAPSISLPFPADVPAGSPATGDATACLRVTGLTVQYRGFTALRDITIDIPEGEITALVGPSGCGKSSFLHSLNRLTDLVPGCRVTGSIHLADGTEVTHPKADVLTLRGRVGIVFQRPNPFPQSIRRNFEIPLREHGWSKEDIPDRMETVLRQVGLWNEVHDRLHKSAIALSGGQLQRLCIARALALEPAVILFDEPCSALDPLASGVVEDLIHSLRGQLTIVIVTHNLAQARRIADHAAVFWVRDGAGTMVEHGPAARVFSSPADPDAGLYLSGARG
ncbi:MAG: Phosphate transporter ATP-binding protein [Verrucomicrobiales bacterium]|nr:Phosphate transporter ATP-binding protein [Verrucomicrobiales bacterium]